jgi:hypothetical protein
MTPENSLPSPSNVDKQGESIYRSVSSFFSIFSFSSSKHHNIEASVAEANRQLAIAESNKITSAEIDKKVDQTLAAADAVLSQIHTPRNF